MPKRIGHIGPIEVVLSSYAATLHCASSIHDIRAKSCGVNPELTIRGKLDIWVIVGFNCQLKERIKIWLPKHARL